MGKYTKNFYMYLNESEGQKGVKKLYKYFTPTDKEMFYYYTDGNGKYVLDPNGAVLLSDDSMDFSPDLKLSIPEKRDTVIFPVEFEDGTFAVVDENLKENYDFSPTDIEDLVDILENPQNWSDEPEPWYEYVNKFDSDFLREVDLPETD